MEFFIFEIKCSSLIMKNCDAKYSDHDMMRQRQVIQGGLKLSIWRLGIFTDQLYVDTFTGMSMDVTHANDLNRHTTAAMVYYNRFWQQVHLGNE